MGFDKPAAMTTKSKKRKQTPESQFWDTLKGQAVEIEYVDGTFTVGRLLWVDHYTIGLDLNGGTEMIYKHSIKRIYRRVAGA